jgi:hypothetical protein
MAFEEEFAGSQKEPPDPEVQRLGQAAKEAGVGADCPCPVCRQAAGWGIYRHVAGLLQANGEGKGLGALALTCQNCGFIRLHGARPLDRFMRP